MAADTFVMDTGKPDEGAGGVATLVHNEAVVTDVPEVHPKMRIGNRR